MNEAEPSHRAQGSKPDGGFVGRLKAWIHRLKRESPGEASLRETLEELIEEQPASAPIETEERALIANILRLRNVTARDVMVPRSDIVAIEVEVPFADSIKEIMASAHSRIPVYRETLDDVLGMVHIKDVMAAMADRREVPLKRLLRKVLFVSPAMHAIDLLIEMRSARTHMALVVDEYGGVDGLITIEDLVEQIVGEIEDEHDEAETPKLVQRPDGSLLADARATIEEFEATAGSVLSDEEREEADTLGGLIFALTGRIPGRGEIVRHSSGIEFEVVEADARRVKRLRVLRLPPKPVSGNEASSA
jgi:CBS domain containing-hemolysin-like protein